MKATELKKLKNNIKRRLAALMMVVMVIETPMTAVAAIEPYEGNEDNKVTVNMKGEPEAAFSKLQLSIMKTILASSSDAAGSSLGLTLDAALDDDYLQNTLDEQITAEKVLDEYEFDALADKDKPAPSYDEYLDASSDLPSITFESGIITLVNDALDLPKLPAGEIVVDNEVIGTYEVVELSDGTYKLQGSFKKRVYYRRGVTCGSKIDAVLEKTYDEDTTIDIDKDAGDNDLTITIPEGTGTEPGDANYAIGKEVIASGNNLVYTITAVASSGDAAAEFSVKEASDSSLETGRAYKSSRKKKAKKHRRYNVSSDSNASGSNIDDDDEDYEDDEDESEERKGILFSTLFENISTNTNLPEGVTLAGRQIVDAIPNGLELVSVEFSSDGSSFEKLEEAEYTYDKNTLTYTLPLDYKEAIAVVKITTKLSNELYNKHMLEGNTQTYPFSNQARLKGEDDTTLAVSQTARENITLGAPFAKGDGTISSNDKRNIDWKLTVNADAAGFNQLYVVDHIADIDNTHNYIASSSILIKKKNGDLLEEKTLKKITLSDTEGSYAYGDIKGITAIENILTDKIPDAATNTDPYFYTYESSAGIYDAVMLIPVKKYTGQVFTIDYSTKISKSDDDLFKGQNTVKLENDAKILWNWQPGIGPGGDFGGADIKKETELKYNMVTKAGTVENQSNEDIVTWKFDLNEYGAKDLQYLDITDTFIDANQELLDPTASSSELVLKGPSGEEVSITRKNDSYPLSPDDKKSVDNFYAIVKDSTAGKTTFFLHLKGDDDASTPDYEKYYFTLKTQVRGGAIDSSNNTATVTNKATVEGMVGETPLGFTAEGSCQVQNTLIRKQTLSLADASNKPYYYDYNKNIVKWGITINPKEWTIRNPVLTDELPEGVRFDLGDTENCQITKVTYGGIGIATGSNITVPANKDEPWVVKISDNLKVNITEQENTAVTTPNGFSHKTIQFEFVDGSGSSTNAVINNTFAVEFTTSVEKAYRNSLKSEKSNSKTLDNGATLTGTVVESEKTVDIKAKDNAKNSYLPKPILKTGEYVSRSPYDQENGRVPTENTNTYPEVARIDWTLYVNRAKADMGGAVIEDIIKDYMELVPASMRAYNVNLDAGGKEATSSEITDVSEIFGTDIDYDHFRYKIPTTDEYKNQTLKFTFTTILVDDAAASDMTNTVTVKKGEYEDSNDSSQAVHAQTFKVDSYATAKNLYFARIFKTSTNGTNRFPLAGAKFKITEMELPAGENGTILSNYVSKGSSKTRTSNSRGKVNFMFLKADTMYKIEETVAPTNYQIPYYDWYIVPKMVDELKSWPANMVTPPEESSPRPGWVILNKTDKNYQALTFTNEVSSEISAAGKLTFQKLGYNNKPLSDVWFEISGPRLNSHQVKSNENGMVTFDRLEPLTETEKYTIKEIAPTGSVKDGTEGYRRETGRLFGKVYIESGSVVTKLENGTFEEGLFTEASPSTLKNEPITADASFTKIDQNGTGLEGVAFTIKRYGDSSADNMQMALDPSNLVSFVGTNYQSYKPLGSNDENYIVKSDNKGVVKLKNLVYGDYLLTETIPDTAIDKNKTIKLRLRVEKQGVARIYNEKETKWVDVSNLTGDNYTVENQIQYGFIQIEKILGKPDGNGKLEPVKDSSGKNIPLAGVRFDIYQDVDDNGTYDSNTDQLFMKLITNDKGEFAADVDGNYEQSDKQSDKTTKVLTVGNYLLKETSEENELYVVDERYYPFTIASWKEMDKPLLANATKISSDQTDFFLNAAKRKVISVTKQVEQFDDTWSSPEDSDGTFIFRLTGTPSDATAPINKEMHVDSSTGQAVFTDIPSGTYTLTEKLTGKLPDGRNMADVYVKPNPIQVTVDENGVSYDNGQPTTAPVTVQNHLKRGSISGKKFTEDGNSPFALAGATFKLVPQPPAGGEEDALTAFSGKDGSIKFDNLPLGTYKLSETKAPHGYKLDDTVYKITLTTEGVKVEQGDDGSGSLKPIEFVNQAVSSITLIKTVEVLEGSDLSGTEKPGEGFEFCISGTSFDSQEIIDLYNAGKLTVTGAASPEMRTDGPEGPGLYVVTDSSGRVNVSGLPVGKYHVTEVENGKNNGTGIYVRDTERKDADIEIDHGNGKVSTPVVEVENRLKRGDIQGLKTRTDKTTPLAGAVIGLFPADAAEFTEATLYKEQKVTTGEDGVFRFTGIPCGEYQIRELSAPGGYYLNTQTVFKVKVTEDKALVTRGETAAGEEEILITNEKKSSGGGGGGNHSSDPKPSNPSAPGAGPGAPADPAGPGESETPDGAEPEIPTVPAEPDGEGGTVVIIPPEIPPGSDIIITDRDHNTVFEGKTESDGNVHVNLPPGEYELVTIDEDGVPKAQMTFTILEDEIPLAALAPDAGDHALPLALLGVILLGALAGVVIVLKKRRDLDKEE